MWDSRRCAKMHTEQCLKLLTSMFWAGLGAVWVLTGLDSSDLQSAAQEREARLALCGSMTHQWRHCPGCPPGWQRQGWCASRDAACRCCCRCHAAPACCSATAIGSVICCQAIPNADLHHHAAPKSHNHHPNRERLTVTLGRIDGSLNTICNHAAAWPWAGVMLQTAESRLPCSRQLTPSVMGTVGSGAAGPRRAPPAGRCWAGRRRACGATAMAAARAAPPRPHRSRDSALRPAQHHMFNVWQPAHSLRFSEGNHHWTT